MNKAEPMITVITVVRNGELNLAQTIESVVMQTYPRIEFIIVDGASTDGTAAIIKRYRDFVTRWISEPDRGIYDAMNKGIRSCRGDYVYFLNCGDYFLAPQTIANMVDSLPPDLPSIVCGKVTEEDSTGGSPSATARLETELDLFTITLCHQSLFVSRQLFAEVGDFDLAYRLCADREWLLRALMVHNCRICYRDIPICFFEGSGVSSRQKERLRWENARINLRYFGWQGWVLLLRKVGRRMVRALHLAVPPP